MLGWQSDAGALHAPATLRNREPILAALRRLLPGAGRVLEIAAGSGEHAVHFAGALSHLVWQPSDPDPQALASIAAHRAAAGLPNLEAPLSLDACAPVWPIETAEAVIAINMIHIAPPEASEGLMAGAGRVLAPGGILFLYGPFVEDGVETAPSNRAFDADLRRRDPSWGLRDLGCVAETGRRHGLLLEERIVMPANNLGIVFRKGG